MKTKIYSLIVLMFLTVSCKKDWLDQKPNQSLTVATKFDEFQLLLDNRTVFGINLPGLGEIGSDDSYLTDDIWNSLSSEVDRNAYIWKSDVFEKYQIPSWTYSYQQIFQANIVLDGIEKLRTKDNLKDYNLIRGQALFYRAVCYWALADLFCKPYDGTNIDELGLPLNLDSQIGKKLARSSLKELFDRIINDLKEAEELLPENFQIVTRPSANSCRALLSRIYLNMDAYELSLSWALKIPTTAIKILDFNELDSTLAFPIKAFNEEVIWHAEFSQTAANMNRTGFVSKDLIESYQSNDLRKTIYFSKVGNEYQFRGNYRGTKLNPFAGFTYAEIILNIAECQIRLGKQNESLEMLTKLIIKRYKNYDLNSIETGKLLEFILDERRKELVFRAIRWSDLRRLNRDSRFARKLIRKIGDKIYALEPLSNKYVYPIPEDEIILNNLKQNPR